METGEAATVRWWKRPWGWLEYPLSSIAGLLLAGTFGLFELFLLARRDDGYQYYSAAFAGVLVCQALTGYLSGRFLFRRPLKSIYDLVARATVPGLLTAILLFTIAIRLEPTVFPYAVSGALVPIPLVFLGIHHRYLRFRKMEGGYFSFACFREALAPERKPRAGQIAFLSFVFASVAFAFFASWIDEHPLPRTQKNLCATFNDARSLSAWDALRLEWYLKFYPDDEDARVLLLGYYENIPFFWRMNAGAEFENYSWFVDNRPGFEWLWRFSLSGDRCPDAVARWKRRKAGVASDFQVLKNAASQASKCDPRFAVSLYKRIEKLYPADEDAPQHLGHIYARDGDELGVSSRQALKLALEAYERAVARSEEEYLESPLEEAAETAMDLGDVARAERHARRLVAWAEGEGRDPDWAANALHAGHNLLGRVALSRKDISTAKRELLLAGDVKGSFTLNSFGPNMRLAEELLKAGERKVVLKYFKKLSKFWQCGCHGSLDEWAKTIRSGGIPDFGANLIY